MNGLASKQITPARALGRVVPYASRVALVVLAIVHLAIFSGCTAPLRSNHPLTPAYKPRNVFVWGSSLPPHIRRVAILPMACDNETQQLSDGRETLEPVLRDELAKTHLFETVFITSEALRTRTGKDSWACQEALPHDLFSWLNEASGCDAVLFCQLTVFRGYPPLAVGWRMRLIDARTRATLWAEDEVFDAGRSRIQSGARRHQLINLLGCGSSPDEWVIENSPRQFGQYAATQVLSTLPGW